MQHWFLESSYHFDDTLIINLFIKKYNLHRNLFYQFDNVYLLNKTISIQTLSKGAYKTNVVYRVLRHQYQRVVIWILKTKVL